MNNMDTTCRTIMERHFMFVRGFLAEYLLHQNDVIAALKEAYIAGAASRHVETHE